MPLEIGKDIKEKEIPREDIKDGWYPAKKYVSPKYDLVKLKESFDSVSIPGWWTGRKWDGLRVKNITYKYWKKISGNVE